MRIFNTRFARPLPKNILTVVKANMVEALAEANVDENNDPLPALEPFIAFYLARQKGAYFPFVSAYRRRVPKIDQNESQMVESLVEFAVEVGAVGSSEDKVQAELEIRVEAVDSIIRAAALNDLDALLKGFSEDVKGLVTLDIPKHDYGQADAQGTQFIQVAAITLTAQLVEV